MPRSDSDLLAWTLNAFSIYLFKLEERFNVSARNHDEYDDFDDIDDDTGEYQVRTPRRKAKRPRSGDPQRAAEVHAARERERRRVDISKPFKCRMCNAFIGEPPTGGRQRNHCPACLFSLHVDLKTPGDRASDCNSLMEPVATFFRPNGEQVLVHRCRGCGVERHNRIAADDSPVLLESLEIIEPRTGAASDM